MGLNLPADHTLANMQCTQQVPQQLHFARPNLHLLCLPCVRACGHSTTLLPVHVLLFRPDKDRFQRPYIHTMSVADSRGQAQQVSLTIKQQKFSSEGFASTGWWNAKAGNLPSHFTPPDIALGVVCL